METLLSPFTPEPPKPTSQDFFEKHQLWIAIGTIVLFAVGLYFIFVPTVNPLTSANAQTTDTKSASEETPVSLASTTPISNSEVVIDIAGGINKPGVYHLGGNTIIEDAIVVGGGFSRQADINAIARTINRAELLQNHTKIYIPKIGDGSMIPTTATSSPRSEVSSTTRAKININEADGTELELLPGIGPVTAQNIIDYRITSGSFKTIEDIKNVPGISDGKFDQLKDFITT